MKIMVCGGSGQLGRDCTRVLEQNYETVSFTSRQLDITDQTSVNDTVNALKPSVVVNCAAYTKVDASETEKELAWNINAEGPKHLAIASQRSGSLLVHISTDYVFDGEKSAPEPYGENDLPHPLSCYGETKLEGEKLVQESAIRYIIVRTAWLYGVYGHNFPKTMLRLALANPRKEIRVVDDQFGSPTWSCTLARQIKKLIEVDGQGIYHATAEGYCTWYDFARFFLQEMGVPHVLSRCTSQEYPTPARRPRNSILENRHLKRESINLMRDWDSDLIEYAARFHETLLNDTR